MDDKVKRMLLVLLQEKDLVASWGISQIHVKETSISFNVAGFLYQGQVTVSADGANYEIRFASGDFCDTSLENLVSDLDRHIEKDSRYLQRLETWFDSK